eukprot:TRINITY_DN592_c0_g1_i1.p1 TRINITY_DN592_c0_g1~~TRINITY_DN592_c0_g1_i1.p1  ORF type:complete len:617 (-),score=141.77 TRINITY_DN592_c0_g1_i1:156-1985(-)
MAQKRGRPLNVQPARRKLNELFLTWLTLPETQDLLTGIALQTEGKELGPKIVAPKSAAKAMPLSLDHLFHPEGLRDAGEVSPNQQSQKQPKVVDEYDRMKPNFTSPPSSPKPNFLVQPAPAPLSPHGHRPHQTDPAATSSATHMSPPRMSPTRHLSAGSFTLPSPPTERPASASLIPRFWFPETQGPSPEDVDREAKAIAAAFKPKAKTAKGAKASLRTFKLQGPPESGEWTEFVTKVLGLPGWWATQIFHRLTKPGGEVTYKLVKDWWDTEMANFTREQRFFNFLKNDTSRAYLLKKDFEPFVQDLLLSHPGLEFLKQTPEFQEKYAETVVVRIFYTVNRSGNGKLTFKEYCNSRLHDVMLLLDSEDDINNVTEFFSYEHFYVLYCKFWELDNDHDFYISKEDLLKYNNYSLTETLVDIIFKGVPRPLSSDKPDKMNYEDFIWFCLSEEDKTSDTSIAYWFRCVDLNHDGVISGYQLDYFFAEQKKRMESFLTEQIQFDDILCQMVDMIHPKDPNRIRLSDLKACPTSGIFFNVLFNLNKFIAFEQRDPFQAHAEKQNSAERTDWDRFARIEYDRMAMEAEQSDEYGDGEGSGKGGAAADTPEWRPVV